MIDEKYTYDEVVPPPPEHKCTKCHCNLFGTSDNKPNNMCRTCQFDDIRAQLATRTKERDELAAHCQALRSVLERINRTDLAAVEQCKSIGVEPDMSLINLTTEALKSTPADSLKALLMPTLEMLNRLYLISVSDTKPLRAHVEGNAILKEIERLEGMIK